MKMSLRKKLKSVLLLIACLFTISAGYPAQAAEECEITKIDLVFYLDATPNMYDYFREACYDIQGSEDGLTPGIISRLQQMGYSVNYHVYGIGAGRPRDYTSWACVGDGTVGLGDTEAGHVIYNPTGVDRYAWGPATSWVSNNYPAWTAGSIRIIVPVSNNCPAGAEDGGCFDASNQTYITQAISDAKNHNVIVAPISLNETNFPFARSLAEQTGGVVVRNETSADFAQAIRRILPEVIQVPCSNKCFGDTLRSGTCQNGACVYSTDVSRCDNPGPCESGPGTCVILGGTATCQYTHSDAGCTTPGTCQVGNGTCVVINGQAVCQYQLSAERCTIAGDSDQCAFNICKSNDNGATAFCARGPNVCGGMVPCGRLVDDPSTPNDETQSCNFCHLALVANNVINFMFGIVSTLAVLAIIMVGFLYIFSAGNPGRRNKAKEALSNVIKGYAIVFLAWLIVDFLLSAWGFINPLGGNWNVMCLLQEVLKSL